MEESLLKKVSACFQCQKCTNGCPVSYTMETPPHTMIRMLQVGVGVKLLEGDSIWVCAGCETCSTRCPNDIEISKVIDRLRQLCLTRGGTSAEKSSPYFHQVFSESIRKNGRIFELGMISKYKVKTGNIFPNSKMGMGLIKRGKLKLFPTSVKNNKEIERMFKVAEEKGDKE